MAKLHELAGKPIVLIVDEAQQALKTEAGINTMFALKAARDQLNRSNEKPKLMLVFTGSHRDKLAHLVLKRDQPFFGSSITSFPLLGHDFIKAFTLWVNAHLSSNNLFNEESVGEAFKLVGHKPEMLRSLIGSVAISGEANNLSGVLNEKAVEFHDMIWEDISSNYSGLNVMQKAILQVMIAKRGSSYPPFSAESISEYKRITGEKEISTTTVQTMIESLRDKGFIWNPSRGSYALEDDGFAEWYLRTQVIEVPEK